MSKRRTGGTQVAILALLKDGPRTTADMAKACGVHITHCQIAATHLVRDGKIVRLAKRVYALPGSTMPLTECACGCGQRIALYSKDGRLTRCAYGHNVNPPRRERNPNWKGGVTVAKGGYIAVKVQPGDEEEAATGYALEHRVIARKTIGRPLLKGEIIHHVNGDKTDNRPENLEVLSGTGEHNRRHPDKIAKWTRCGLDARWAKHRSGMLAQQHEQESRLILMYIEASSEYAHAMFPATTATLADFIGQEFRYTYNLLLRLERRGIVDRLRKVLYGGQTLWVKGTGNARSHS